MALDHVDDVGGILKAGAPPAIGARGMFAGDQTDSMSRPLRP